MGDPAAVATERSQGALKVLGLLLMGLSVTLVIVAVMLPTHTLEWLRSEYWYFGVPLNWLETISPTLDLTHAILFAWVALLWSLLWSRAAWWRIGLLMVGLAAGSELLQFFVPGRSPLISDVYDDLLGAAIGLVLAIAAKWIARRWVTRAS